MKKIRDLCCLLFALFLVIIPFSSLNAALDPEDSGDEQVAPVGRLSHLEGEVSQYLPDQDQWVAAAEDAPFGMDDILRCGPDGRAEVIIPNNTWIRMNNDSQVHLVTLQPDVTGVAVDAGIVRFLNKGSKAVVRTSTPFGSVTASSGSSFDIYVDDTSVEVLALTGLVSFVDASGRGEYQVIAGSSSLVADRYQVSAGRGIFDRDWEAWNNRRDNVWRMRARGAPESRDYLPPALYDEAYVLDRYGRWVKVYYDGAYRVFWRPFHIAIGWAPFTRGRWMMWHGDYCWIPDEPFGYLTHHYGNWVFVDNFWYWAPPVVGFRTRSGSSFLHIGFAWYPGRVGWVRSGLSIGWVPLAPHEPYYCRHRWGPRVVVVKNIQKKTIIVKKRRYRYARHTVLGHRKDRTWIHRQGRNRTFAERKSRSAPSRSRLRMKRRKKPGTRHVMDRKERRDSRRTFAVKQYTRTPRTRTRRHPSANPRNVAARRAMGPKFASAGRTGDQPPRKSALYNKRTTAGSKTFQSREKARRVRFPGLNTRVFHRNEQAHNRKQLRTMQRFKGKPERKGKNKPRRTSPAREKQWVARAEGGGGPKAPFRSAWRHNEPRTNWRASLWQR